MHLRDFRRYFSYNLLSLFLKGSLGVLEGNDVVLKDSYGVLERNYVVLKVI